MSEYRIVTDEFLGFEVQIRRWWWPFWSPASLSNTHPTIERAEQWARGHAREPVKYLGRIGFSPNTQEGRE